ncbi:leucine--tRNA ligase [Patescibacteria group bacterium]|nr:leucine--tRNA ligase [Patescibacteria group bacterium]
MKRYDPSSIEPKWQKQWDEDGVYVARDKGKKEKKYVLIEFPYPSGEGLHMGHLRPYVAGDVMSRFLRMRGHEVMYPMGWDAFGLPAENYAIKKGIHPRVTTAKNIENAKRQVKSWGIGFDWSREVNTTDPGYYKWTQWLFLQFFKAGLAYEATGSINWCPKDKTGLANEEVIGGKCDRCGTEVVQKEVRQWYLKITEYADELIDGLKDLDWPESVKVQQENWIGRSEGALIDFQIQDTKYKIQVFTTRPDTLFGATYMVIAPEHPLLENKELRIENRGEVDAYVAKAKAKTEEERITEGKEKTGVELKGIKAVNPANGKMIPVFVADYVLGGYGTGAIMAVPAHDERDFAFAKKFGLPVIDVISGGEPGELWEGAGDLINSGKFTGMSSEEAKKAITDFVHGKMKKQYRLRDWVFSRQRYWGEPIPLIHCEKCGVVPVPDDELPVRLPEVEKYEPTGTGESPLAAIESWVNTKCPQCGGEAKRETNTMPQWAGSSWYYLRYTDPKNAKEFAAMDKMKYWLPVDMYFGGIEHTTLHLLYSRFWHLFLHDQKLVPTPEPYARRVTHGIILGPDGEKMSKSRGNVVNPDEIVKEFGADALRMYELFLGPHEAMVSWNSQGILGVSRFLDRLWNFILSGEGEGNNEEAARVVDRAVKKVTEDIENIKFNTAISSLMICLNAVEGKPAADAFKEKLLKMIAPFAPHVAEELWHETGHKNSIHLEKWPEYDEELIKEAEISVVVQVNGKYRGTITAPTGLDQKDATVLALRLQNVSAALDGKTPKKTIYIKDRLINFVA